LRKKAEKICKVVSKGAVLGETKTSRHLFIYYFGMMNNYSFFSNMHNTITVFLENLE
jgi:hypothetical protein